MKVHELVKTLLKADQNADIEFLVNPSNADDEHCDIKFNAEIFGEDIIEALQEISIVLTPKVKSSQDFETIHELLSECNKVTLEMDDSGIFVFGDGELRRELDFNCSADRTSEFVKKIIEIL